MEVPEGNKIGFAIVEEWAGIDVPEFCQRGQG